MSSDIKAGDLVMVVKPDVCGCKSDIGKIYVVQEIIDTSDDLVFCDDCGVTYQTNFQAVRSFISNADFAGNSTECLIKIDPPALQDETENELEIAQ